MMDEAAAAQDIILFIDEIHNIIGAGAAEGSIDAANILKPQLSRGEIQLMGATTVAEYRRYIEKDSRAGAPLSAVCWWRSPATRRRRADSARHPPPLRGSTTASRSPRRPYRPRCGFPGGYLHRPLSAGQSHRPDGRGRRPGLPAGILPPDPTCQELERGAARAAAEKSRRPSLRQDFEQAAILRDRQNQTVEQLALLTDQLAEKARRAARRGHRAGHRPGGQREHRHPGLVADVPHPAPVRPEPASLLGMEQSLSRRVVGQQEAVARGLQGHPARHGWA